MRIGLPGLSWVLCFPPPRLVFVNNSHHSSADKPRLPYLITKHVSLHPNGRLSIASCPSAKAESI
jgi:hypothetical protein